MFLSLIDDKICTYNKGCCQLQAKVCAQSTGYPLSQACPGKSVVRSTDRLDMTLAVDWDVKNQTKPKIAIKLFC